MRSVTPGLMAAGVGMAVNVVLAIVKIATGILGNSYALMAEGIESTTDIGHEVTDQLKASSLSIQHVVDHVEPAMALSLNTCAEPATLAQRQT